VKRMRQDVIPRRAALMGAGMVINAEPLVSVPDEKQPETNECNGARIAKLAALNKRYQVCAMYHTHLVITIEGGVCERELVATAAARWRGYGPADAPVAMPMRLSL
jgi:hypothetical protein